MLFNRSEERFSRNAETDLVCRLLLEKKKRKYKSHCCGVLVFVFIFFFFNDTATTEIYTLSLHDALPIYALDEEKWLNMLGTFVKDWFRYESHFVHGRDSLVDILKERGLLSESDAVQPLIGKKS